VESPPISIFFVHVHIFSSHVQRPRKLSRIPHPSRCGRLRGRIIVDGSLPLFRFTSPSTRVPGTPSFRPSPHSYPFAPSRSYAFFITLMSDPPSLSSIPSVDSVNNPSRPRKWSKVVWVHITRHVGIGIICSVAYFDPCVPLNLLLLLRTHPQSQGKLGCRSAGRFRLRIPSPLRRPFVRLLCCNSPGNFFQSYIGC